MNNKTKSKLYRERIQTHSVPRVETSCTLTYNHSVHHHHHQLAPRLTGVSPHRATTTTTTTTITTATCSSFLLFPSRSCTPTQPLVFKRSPNIKGSTLLALNTSRH
ncbi:hypothetical protein E2C01_046496 [Portunus trituberculatus]|uniref:Uncharacterized protein n=1 Tax=Portunus trituberculatus TaxID=210409 RepID=A0A5B7G5Y4_PORTR|nr:hypothetical protein [Portunus trituberculatus]